MRGHIDLTNRQFGLPHPALAGLRLIGQIPDDGPHPLNRDLNTPDRIARIADQLRSLAHPLFDFEFRHVFPFLFNTELVFTVHSVPLTRPFHASELASPAVQICHGRRLLGIHVVFPCQQTHQTRPNAFDQHFKSFWN
jgi:hypothetical protein